MPLLAAGRPAQFVTIGGLCALAQLSVLALLRELTGLGSWSNAVAFLLAAQLNFVLNYAFTWRDRRTHSVGVFVRQLAGFNVLVGLGLPVNQGVYLLAETVFPYIVAGAIGIGATTLAKYLIADRWIFPRKAATA